MPSLVSRLLSQIMLPLIIFPSQVNLPSGKGQVMWYQTPFGYLRSIPRSILNSVVILLCHLKLLVICFKRKQLVLLFEPVFDNYYF